MEMNKKQIFFYEYECTLYAVFLRHLFTKNIQFTLGLSSYVLCKGLKIYNRNMFTRSSKRIFNPMRYTGIQYTPVIYNHYFTIIIPGRVINIYMCTEFIAT